MRQRKKNQILESLPCLKHQEKAEKRSADHVES